MCDVSIVIPTFNRLWCLPRAVESCRNTICQTEIIVVDDGSCDGTWSWLLEQDDIVKLRQDNQGQTYAINAGTSIAKGKYIRFLDSDDFLESGIIDKQFQKAEQTGAQLVYSRVDGFDLESKAVTAYPEMVEWEDFMELQLSTRYGSHFLGMLFRTDKVKLVPRRPDFALREDRMFLLEYGLLNPRLAFVPGCAGYWVKHVNQMQGNYSGLKSQAANWQSLNIYKKILAKLNESGTLNESRIAAACTSLWPLSTWIAKDHPMDGLDVYNWILELNPSFKIPENGALGFGYNLLGFKNMQKVMSMRRKIKRLF
ncbi:MULTISPECIES: glycosyltransferase family 2 protein [unclassified Pedobacter]|uniref:glycosyltransferase family 2 protein n=1 Tax=unclassified Pedobacter TaxID=2628915 RepID=UPI001DE314F5|nr:MULTISPECIES: glycosyltransferase family 2 protein [unclassified Pedobacter]CAH0166659.1 GalNAc(5)-diNAcBac-PP-undecaprenol beta-1,3-glucosyltransferase [Pedobacter sp. Bi126]CAH0285126.1 GalNAc(5)-diNAcBac-PP-undecaprenol beta-1,3-glucosyltransferase [Pedobacter sp. Bi36]